MVEAGAGAGGGRGSLNRVIRIAGGPGEVRAVVEDDFHHFRVILRHSDGVVTEIVADAPRFPYSLCPAAGLELRTLIGTALTPRMVDIFAHVDARQQCTHQIDLAALAVTAAARGTIARRYDVEVQDIDGGERHAFLRRDSVPLLDWTLDGYAIAGDAGAPPRGLGSGFTGWAATLDEEAAEAALVLRRGVFISSGRGMAAELDSWRSAPVSGGCWVQQPERAPIALRQKGSTRDFGGRTALLTVSDDHWLAEAASERT